MQSSFRKALLYGNTNTGIIICRVLAILLLVLAIISLILSYLSFPNLTKSTGYLISFLLLIISAAGNLHVANIIKTISTPWLQRKKEELKEKL